MPRIVLEVTNGPRYCGKTRRWQQTGEQVVIDEDDLGEFNRQVILHQNHCRKIIEGELPDPKKVQSFLQRVRTKAAEAVSHVAGKLTGPTFTTAAELASSMEPKPVVPEAQNGESVKCPECDREYKTVEGLTRHMERSGHGKKAEAETE